LAAAAAFLERATDPSDSVGSAMDEVRRLDPAAGSLLISGAV
jgi:hypothetical protein